MVQATLAADDLEVVSAASGDEAVAAFAAQAFDILLLDVRMPGRDGFATLAAIRELPGAADVPVVFLTGLRDVETFDRALAAGAVDFLTKPIRPSELVARVRTLLQVRRLGGELREHHEEIRRQRDALVRLHLQKERLSSFVVHDLKSPLAAVRLHATLLERDPSLSGEALDSARAIVSLSDRLGQLILNLLDLAKADAGQLEPRREPVALDALACGVHAAFGSAASARGLSLRVEGAKATALGDPDLLRRVLENLVDNALRHAPQRTTVTIAASQRDTDVEISVRDEGIGIPEALRERIFERFIQLEVGSESSRSGRGLGLSFCKTAVEIQGGTIRVEATPSGALFVVRLPAPAC